ncbi:MAG: hypothetical protein RJB61_2644 [Actinomycetota bacterium]
MHRVAGGRALGDHRRLDDLDRRTVVVLQLRLVSRRFRTRLEHCVGRSYFRQRHPNAERHLDGRTARGWCGSTRIVAELRAHPGTSCVNDRDVGHSQRREQPRHRIAESPRLLVADAGAERRRRRTDDDHYDLNDVDHLDDVDDFANDDLYVDDINVHFNDVHFNNHSALKWWWRRLRRWLRWWKRWWFWWRQFRRWRRIERWQLWWWRWKLRRWQQ